MTISRRTVIATGLAAGAGALSLPLLGGCEKRSSGIKVGVMLPFTGTYAQLGEQILAGFRLAVAEAGGQVGGREISTIIVDDESDPGKAPENANRLINAQGADLLLGSVHSGVLAGMVKVVRESGTILVCPNAGAASATGAMCAPNIFRASFSNWQPAFPMGKVAFDRGCRTAVTMAWNYGAGEESVGAFEESFAAAGGSLLKRIMVPFPNVEFQAHLTEIAALKPDCVFVFFAGAGALKFVKDWAAAGLKGRVRLLSTGFITEGVLKDQGADAEGILTTLHYADALQTPENLRFRAAFREAAKREADVYSVQGYDAGQLMLKGLAAVNGDASQRPAMIAAMEKAEIVSPRGRFTLSAAHNPVQDIYLREVQGGKEVVLGVAHAALSDPARGCRMA